MHGATWRKGRVEERRNRREREREHKATREGSKQRDAEISEAGTEVGTI